MVNINFLQVKQIIEIGLKNRRKEEMGYGMEDAGLNPDEYDF